MAITYNTIEEALQDLRNGKCILVTDDPDRETRRPHLRRTVRHHGKRQPHRQAPQRD